MELATPMVFDSFLRDAGNDSRYEQFKSSVSSSTKETLLKLVTYRNVGKKTALHISAEMGCSRHLRLLLSTLRNAGLLSPDILNAKSDADYTPLHFAAHTGHKKCAEILLQFGADKDALTCFGKTALEVAKSKRSCTVRNDCVEFLELVQHNPQAALSNAVLEEEVENEDNFSWESLCTCFARKPRGSRLLPDEDHENQDM